MATLEEYIEKGATLILKAKYRHTEDVTVREKLNDSSDSDDALSEAVSSPTGHGEVSFPLDVLVCKNDNLVIDAIRYNDTLVSFDDPDDNIRLDIWLVSETRNPLVYEDVEMTKKADYDIDHPVYYIIRPQENPHPMNRRKAFRVNLEVPCKVMISGMEDEIYGTLKNASTNGFGIEILDSRLSTPLSNEQTLTITFYDDSENLISLQGQCIREERRNGSTFYGGVLNYSDKEFKTYIMNKQTARCRK